MMKISYEVIRQEKCKFQDRDKLKISFGASGNKMPLPEGRGWN
jgi:hypothetical protein